MNSWGHQLICHSWDESGSALVFNVHSSSEKTWQFVWHGSSYTQDLNTEETDLIEEDTLTLERDRANTHFTHTHTHRCKDNPPHPPSTDTHTSHEWGCCQGSAWANWLVASAHHRRNSPFGLAGSVKEAFQDVFPSTPGSLITLSITTHCSSDLISSVLLWCFCSLLRLS